MRRAIGFAIACILPAFSSTAIAAPRSAIATAVATLADGLKALPAGAAVFIGPLETDLPSPRAEALLQRIASISSGQLARPAGSASPLALAEARSLARTRTHLIYVQPKIRLGSLELTADVYPVEKNSWDRIRNPAPGAMQHAHALAKMDAEIRAFFPPIQLESASIHKLSHSEPDVLAAACGDLDGDGGLELALLTSDRISYGHLERGVYRPVKMKSRSQISKRRPVPLRETIGSLAITGDGELLVGDTDRVSVRLNLELENVGTLSGIPGGEAMCAGLAPGVNALGGLFPCANEVAAGITLFDAFRERAIGASDGSASLIDAFHFGNGEVHVRRNTQEIATIANAGAEIAVGDLDLDGAPELVTTSDREDDAFTIHSLRTAGTETKDDIRMKVPVAAGIRALALCPAEDRGLPALVIVTPNEVWLVR